jgi:hypothetical protein
VSACWRFFDRRKIMRKKRQDRPDIVKRREGWFDGQIELDPECLVVIDETWTSTMSRHTKYFACFCASVFCLHLAPAVNG